MKSKIYESKSCRVSVSKTVITSLALLVSLIGFSQAKTLKGDIRLNDVKVESMSVSVEVDSAEEIQSTFSVKDIKEILNEVDRNEEVSFEIICNGDDISNGTKSHVSYKVEGNTNDIKTFLKRVKKIRKAALNYYNTKE